MRLRPTSIPSPFFQFPRPSPAKPLRRPRHRRRQPRSLAPATGRGNFIPTIALAQPLAYALGAALALVLLRLVSLTLELLLPLWEEELRRRLALPETRGQRLLAWGDRLWQRLEGWLDPSPPSAPAAAAPAAAAETLALERARCEENAARMRLEAARLEAAATPPPTKPWWHSLGNLVLGSLVTTAVSALVSRGLHSLLPGGDGAAARRHRSDLALQLREQGEVLSRQLASASLAGEDTTLRSGAQLLEQQLATQAYVQAQHRALEALAGEQRSAVAELGRGLTLVNENLGRLQGNLLAAAAPPAPSPVAAAPWGEFCRRALEVRPGAGVPAADSLATLATAQPTPALLALGLGTTLAFSLLGELAPAAAEAPGAGAAAANLAPAVAEPLEPLELFRKPPTSALARPLAFSLAEADAVSRRSGALLAAGPEQLASLLREHRRRSPALAEALAASLEEHRPGEASLRAMNPDNYGPGGSWQLPGLGPLLALLGQRPTLGKLLLSGGTLAAGYALRLGTAAAWELLLPGSGAAAVTPARPQPGSSGSRPPVAALAGNEGPSLAGEALALLARMLDSLASLLQSCAGKL